MCLGARMWKAGWMCPLLWQENVKVCVSVWGSISAAKSRLQQKKRKEVRKEKGKKDIIHVLLSFCLSSFCVFVFRAWSPYASKPSASIMMPRAQQQHIEEFCTDLVSHGCLLFNTFSQGHGHRHCRTGGVERRLCSPFVRSMKRVSKCALVSFRNIQTEKNPQLEWKCMLLLRRMGSFSS